jgi:hypothetical protein
MSGPSGAEFFSAGGELTDQVGQAACDHAPSYMAGTVGCRTPGRHAT